MPRDNSSKKMWSKEPYYNKVNKIIDKTETTKDGIETVRCGDTLQMLGKLFIQDGVRYFIPMCPHPKEYETITVRGRFCSLCETKHD
jgi:hypothetical protein